jgi:hypothetical protein
MSEEATPQPEPTPEMEVAYRSLSMTLIQAGEVIGAGAARRGCERPRVEFATRRQGR